jgi:hypothetical protein
MVTILFCFFGKELFFSNSGGINWLVGNVETAVFDLDNRRKYNKIAMMTFACLSSSHIFYAGSSTPVGKFVLVFKSYFFPSPVQFWRPGKSSNWSQVKRV